MVNFNSSIPIENFILIDREEAQQTVYILRDDQSVDSSEEIDSETVTANDSYTFSEENSVYDMTKKITIRDIVKCCVFESLAYPFPNLNFLKRPVLEPLLRP